MSVSDPLQNVDLPSKEISNNNRSSSSAESWILKLLLLVLGITLGAFGVHLFWPRVVSEPTKEELNKKAEAPSMLRFSKQRQETIGIEVSSVERQILPSFTWRSGRVALNEERIAHISPPVEGIVRKAPVRLGQTVAAGQVLAVLESRELGQVKLEAYKAKKLLQAEKDLLARVKTAMENTQYLLRLLEAETPLAEIEKKLQDRPIGEWRQQLISTYAKRKQLKAQLDSQKASSGTIPGVALIQTQAELDTATATLVALMEELRFQVKNQVRQAELKVTDAQMQLEIARAKLVLFGLDRKELDLLEDLGDLEKLSELQIKAPFAGTIVEKHAVHSERVTPQFQMFVLADLSSVWITTDIFESDLHLIRNRSNSSIVFRSTIANIAQRKAEIFYTGDLIDKTSRSISLIAQAPNPDRDLKPGMYLEVGFQTGADKPSIFIPIQAVLREAEKAFVFVQKDSEEFWRRDVSLGRTVEDQVEVIHGLQPGERIVTKGGFILKAELFKDQMVGE